MREVFLLLIFCTALAFMYEKSCNRITRESAGEHTLSRTPGRGSNAIFFVLLVLMIFFAGTRTVMNDTAVYLAKFSEVPGSLKALKEIDYTLGSNPLFQIYRILVKAFISESGQAFIFVSSCLVVGSYMLFLKKYASDFGYSVFILIGFTVYAFTMAAIKQTMATAIAIWMIPDVIRGKRLRPMILLAVAMLIHPYVIVYLAAFFFNQKIWDRKTVLLLLATLAASALFDTLMTSVLKITANIGDTYNIDFFSGNAVSVMRLVVYMVVPVLSFLGRKNIRENADRLSIISINLSIISSCFMILASFGGANMFGRMANYMDIFQCMALPAILQYGYKNKVSRLLMAVASVIGYAVFYYTYYSKYMAMGACFYEHISVFELFRSW